MLQQEPQTLPHDLVVVDDQEPDQAALSGSDAEMRVPDPLPLSIVSEPPSSSTRSRISRSPSPEALPLGTNPCPSSETVISARSPRRCMANRMVDACACLIALARPSWAMRSAASSAAGVIATGSRSADTLMPRRTEYVV